MTDTTDTVIDSTVPAPRDHTHRPNRLYQAAAWVAIVAGVVFIVGAVFFTGFALGRHSGYDGPRHHNGQFMPRPMERGGPGMMMGPGMMGPGGPAAPPTSAPASPQPRP